MQTTKRSFRAARQLKLHQRAVDVLDMIVTADKYLCDAQDNLKRWDAANWMDLIRIMSNRSQWEQSVNKYEAIRQRLTSWYIDIMSRIEDVAILHMEDKTVEHEN